MSEIPAIIECPEQITRLLWEGELSPPETMRAGGPGAAPRVRLNDPVSWPLPGAFAKHPLQEMPPATGKYDGDWWLLQLTVDLIPPAKGKLEEATLELRLECPNGGRPVVADIFPVEELVEAEREVWVGLGVLSGVVQFFIGAGSAPVSLLDSKIRYRKRFPIIQGHNTGDPDPGAWWEFKHHEAKPLGGMQSVFAVVVVPKGADFADAQLNVKALVATSLWDRFWYGTPQPVRGERTFKIPDKGTGVSDESRRVQNA
jgi:hypothetical protein